MKTIDIENLNESLDFLLKQLERMLPKPHPPINNQLTPNEK